MTDRPSTRKTEETKVETKTTEETPTPAEEAHETMKAGGGTEATSAELNPAFYPKDSKPEAMHNEAEKAGAEFPGGGPFDEKAELARLDAEKDAVKEQAKEAKKK